MSLEDRAVYIGGLPRDIEEETVAWMFRETGKIAHVYLCESSGGAYVVFRDKAAVTAAITSMNGKAIPVRTRSQKLQLSLLAQEEEAEETIDQLFRSLTPSARKRALSRIDDKFQERRTNSTQKPARKTHNRSDGNGQDVHNITTQKPSRKHTQPQIVEEVDVAHSAPSSKPEQRIKDTVGESFVVMSEPRLSCFSGTAKETTYARWKHEVQCLDDGTQNDAIVRSAIRKSLRGPAADVAIRMGEDMSVKNLLKKFDSLYGTVTNKEAVWEKFYSAKQDVEEGCAAWGIRVEGLLYEAVRGRVGEHEEKMLRDRFWSGIADVRLKDALRQQRENLQFEQLVQEARCLEEEFSSPKQKTKSSIHVQHSEIDPKSEGKLNEILERIQKLELELKEDCATPKQKAKPSSHVQQSETESKDETRFKEILERMQKLETELKTSKTQSKPPQRAKVCFRCNTEGHLAFGCRAGMDITCYKCNKTGHVARACTYLNE
jgi:hypothetical protein